jgi:hypothetical protein
MPTLCPVGTKADVSSRRETPPIEKEIFLKFII